MRLMPVPEAAGGIFPLRCCVCHHYTKEAVADLDGTPFEAYYCPDCIPNNPGGVDEGHSRHQR